MTLLADLYQLTDPERAKNSARFFKTAPGEYGEGDKFLGIRVPDCRRIAKKYKQLPLPEVEQLLRSEFHEIRLTAFLILVAQYVRASQDQQQTIYDFYLSHTKYVNNWDLVDSTAHKIVGRHLLNRPRDILYQLAKSDNLWQRRISIISTFAFIDQQQYQDSLKLAQILLNDHHDLIHKAVGWVLREIGKKDQSLEEKFLKQHYQQMPRTMLRYAIEKFPEPLRQNYLKGEI